jgi:hypothetical protein
LIAATGDVLAARTAGMSADATVTTTPTSTAAITVRPNTTGFASGAPRPMLEKPTARSRTRARPIPTARPSPAATTPTIAASSTTEPSTCARLAPRARSNPSSRVRCAMRIANVLKMMNEPTTRPTAANPTNAMRRFPTPWRTGSARSSASFAAGTTSKLGPSAAERSRETVSAGTPASVVT